MDDREKAAEASKEGTIAVVGEASKEGTIAVVGEASKEGTPATVPGQLASPIPVPAEVEKPESASDGCAPHLDWWEILAFPAPQERGGQPEVQTTGGDL